MINQQINNSKKLNRTHNEFIEINCFQFICSQKQIYCSNYSKAARDYGPLGAIYNCEKSKCWYECKLQMLKQFLLTRPWFKSPWETSSFYSNFSKH